MTSSVNSAEHFIVPRHVAIIMDGNGRWAQSRSLERTEGHKQGVRTVRRIVEHCCKLDVSYLTLFSFSTENWGRPEKEIHCLMELLQQNLIDQLELMVEHSIRLRVIGDIDRLPSDVIDAIRHVKKVTEKNTGMQLVLALSYGGRNDIITATKKICKEVLNGTLEIDTITEELFARKLTTDDIPDPDLLIRTSRESRISNFLLWQLAYSEIVITDVPWPEFTESNLEDCFREFTLRERRYGLV